MVEDVNAVALRLSLLSMCALGLLAPGRALACQDRVVDSPPMADSTRTDTARVSLLSRSDLRNLGFAVIATAALATADHSISSEFFEPHWLGSPSVQRVAGDVAFFGGSGPFFISTALYAGGIAFHQNALADASSHTIEAIALATGFTGLAKGISGRALPGVATRASFQFGRGFHHKNGPFVSFPSGHASSAFAMMSTIDGEIAREHPDAAATLQPVLFAGAAAVGVARVVQRVHWPSDLPLAAFIGMWSGRTVERVAYRRSKAAAAVHGLIVVPDANGRTRLGWSSASSAAGIGR
jgi:membrane-associated phospholipid phosphatase